MKEFLLEVAKNESRLSHTRKLNMTKNKELRKKLEEKEIRDGWAKPKKNYTGFEDDDVDNTK